jgi:plastocyanin
MAQTHMVSITNFRFTPQSLDIAVGDSVQWTNDSTNQQHSATSDDGVQPAFDSKLLNAKQAGQPPQSYTYMLNAAGTYPYHCTKHMSMTGTITVK